MPAPELLSPGTQAKGRVSMLKGTTGLASGQKTSQSRTPCWSSTDALVTRVISHNRVLIPEDTLGPSSLRLLSRSNVLSQSIFAPVPKPQPPKQKFPKGYHGTSRCLPNRCERKRKILLERDLEIHLESASPLITQKLLNYSSLDYFSIF